MYNTMATVPTC